MSARRLLSRLSFVVLVTGLLATPAALSAPAGAAEVVQDGGFEATVDQSNPYWANEDQLYDDGDLCTTTDDYCSPTGNPAVAPRSGAGWVWFGGNATAGHTAYVRQSLAIPPDKAMLTFYTKAVSVGAPYDTTVTVSIDGTPVATVTEPPAEDTAYQQHVVDVSAFANGAGHVLEFTYLNASGGYVDFQLDDVSLVSADTIAPQTTINAGPAAGIAKSLTVPVAFTSTEAGSTFRCQLDSAAYAACTSPQAFTVTPGAHTIRVVATDASGNADASPAVVAFKAYDCATLLKAVQKAKKKVKAVKGKLRDAKDAGAEARIEKLAKKLKKAKKALRKAKQKYAPCK